VSEAAPGHHPEPEMALVLTTVPDREVGERLVERLLEERRVACGNILTGLLSLYRWEGAISREEEVMVLLKTRADGVGRLFERITELHPYEVPELVQIPVGQVSQAYCRWVFENTKEGQ